MNEVYYEGRLDDVIFAEYKKSREAFLCGDILRADQIYAANRRHHCVDLFYEVALPEHVLFVHPLGTVLGRASYGDHLVVYQNVGVGSSVDGDRPEIGEGVVLFPGAKVLGKTKIGNNVWVTANTVVHNVNVPDNSVVFPVWGPARPGQPDEPLEFCVRAGWRPTGRSVVKRFFPVVQ